MGNLFIMDDLFIPVACGALGPDMHEGAAAKLAPNKPFFQVVLAMHLVDLRAQLGSAQTIAASVPGRMRLLAANLQRVDQVPLTF